MAEYPSKGVNWNHIIRSCDVTFNATYKKIDLKEDTFKDSSPFYEKYETILSNRHKNAIRLLDEHLFLYSNIDILINKIKNSETFEDILLSN